MVRPAMKPACAVVVLILIATACSTAEPEPEYTVANCEALVLQNDAVITGYLVGNEDGLPFREFTIRKWLREMRDTVGGPGGCLHLSKIYRILERSI